jgi:hypothetical protein
MSHCTTWGEPKYDHMLYFGSLYIISVVWKCGHSELNGVTIWENSRMQRSESATVLCFGSTQSSCLLWKHFAWDNQRHIL